MVDLICIGLLELQGPKTENYKMRKSCPQRTSDLRPLNHKSSAISLRLSVIQNLTSRIQVFIVLSIATSYHATEFSLCRVFSIVVIKNGCHFAV